MTKLLKLQFCIPSFVYCLEYLTQVCLRVIPQLSKLILELSTEDRSRPCMQPRRTLDSILAQTIPGLWRGRKGAVCCGTLLLTHTLIAHPSPFDSVQGTVWLPGSGTVCRALHQSYILFASHWLSGPALQLLWRCLCDAFKVGVQSCVGLRAARYY